MRYAYIVRDVKEQVNREIGRFFDTQSPSNMKNLQKGIQFNEELLSLSSSLDEIIRNYENRLHNEIDTTALTMVVSQESLETLAQTHFQTSWYNLMPSEKLSLLKKIKPIQKNTR